MPLYRSSRRKFLAKGTCALATLPTSAALLLRPGEIAALGGNEEPFGATPLIGGVSAARFGALGDGRTDDTRSIQAALDSGAPLVVLEDGKFGISAPLRLAPGQTLTCRSGAIRALARKRGALNRQGEHIVLASDSVLHAVTILPPAPGFHFDGSPKRIVRLGGDRAQVLRCRIERGELPAHASVDTGISILEPVDDCVIQQNELIGCGIQYAGGGARNTRCTGNRLIRPIGNGLTGTGNNPRRSSIGHQLLDNEVIGPSRMGIEEQSRSFDSPPSHISGTLMLRNRVVGGPSAEYFGISAVGEDTILEDNRVVDWPSGYALELYWNHGAKVRRNVIEWPNGNPGNAYGIAINPGPGPNLNRRVEVVENTISRPYWAVRLAKGELWFNRNTVTGAKSGVLDVDPGSSTTIVANGNLVLFKERNRSDGVRTVFAVHGRGSLEGNRIRYDAGANGGSHGERVFFITGPGIVVRSNLVETSNIRGGGDFVTVITAVDGRPSGASIIGNQLIGEGAADLSRFRGVTLRDNSFGLNVRVSPGS